MSRQRGVPQLTATLFLVLLHGPLSGQNIITTYAGTDWIFSGDGKPALTARFKSPVAITVDPNGNPVVADSAFGIVARLNPDGTLSVLAGNGFSGADSGDNGPATSASLSEVVSVAFDRQGNLYIGESGHIRKVTPAGIITTISGRRDLYEGFSGDGGPATAAQFYSNGGLAVDAAGNIYIADGNNNRVRKIDTSGVVTTIVGNGVSAYRGDGGPATSASLSGPGGIAVDGNGNLYIADNGNGCIRKVTAAGLISSFVCNEGLDPSGLAIDRSGTLYIGGYVAVYKLSVGASVPQLIAGDPGGRGGFTGDNGPAANALLNTNGVPVAVDNIGDLFLADNYRIRKISNGIIGTVAGAGFFYANQTPARDIPLLFPADTPSTAGLVGGMVFDASGNLFISEPDNNRVLKISPDGFITTVAGTGALGYSGDGGPATQATLAGPSGLAIYGGNLYIGDSGNAVRRITPEGIITTYSTAPNPNGLAFDQAGNLFATCGYAQVCKIDTSGKFTFIAGTGSDAAPGGDGGAAINATFVYPAGILVDRSGKIYIADYWDSRVRVITPDGLIHAFAGTGSTDIGSGDGGLALQANLGLLSGLAMDTPGNLYLSENFYGGEGRVRVVNPSTGIISTLAGGGPLDQLGDGLPAARATLKIPVGLVFDASGNLLVGDGGSNRVREILANPPVLQVSPATLSFSAPSGGAPVTQTVVVSSSISGVEFTASINSTGGWLSADSSFDSTPRLLAVTADPAKLAPGSYTGVVSIRPNAGGPSQSLAATLQVTAAQPPSLQVDKTEVSFTLSRSVPPRDSTLVVSNSGGQTLNYSAAFQPSTGGNWLAVSPASGSASPGKSSTLTLTANAASLAPGVYTGQIAILSGAGNRTIPVILTVSSNPQAILLTQTGLSFTAVAGGGIVPPQFVGVVNAGTGVMSWNASVSTTDFGNWLVVSPAAGTSAATSAAPQIKVSVNPAGLAPGAYYGTVRVDAPATANQSRVVTAFLQVLPPGTPHAASVQPPELIFYTTPGGLAPGSQAVDVYNITATPKSFTSGRSSEGFVLYTLPPNGTLDPNLPTRVSVQPFASFDSLSSFDAGTTKGTLTFQFSDGVAENVGITIVSAPSRNSGTSSIRTGKLSPNDLSACAPSQLLVKLNSLGQAFQVSAGWPVGLNVSVVDDCQNPVVSGAGSVWAHFNDGEDDVVLTSLGDGTWQGTWKPPKINPNVTMTLNARNGSLSAQRDIAGALASANDQPLFTLASIGSAFSPPVPQISPLAPGSFLSIYGQRMADYSADATTGALPTQLGNTQVFFNRQPAPLSHVDPNQINVVVPYGVNLHTSNQIRVQRGLTLSDPVAVDIADAQPSILHFNGNAYAMDYPADGSPPFQVANSAPPKAGDVLVMYCVGLGIVDQAIKDGGVSPASPAANVPGVVVNIGGQNSSIQFAGLTPGFVGLYQINTVMPAGVPAGMTTLTVSVGGQISPAVNLTVK